MKSTVLFVVAAGVIAASTLSLAAATGDPVRGATLYAECSGCHSFRENYIGPNHCGVFGRKAGTVPGYAYSEAMKDSRIVWDAKKLDAFLTAPLSFVDGTNMGYPGLAEPADRADLIAYLRDAGKDEASCLAASPEPRNKS